MIGQVQRDTKKNYQLYGRNDMIMLDEHNKIYGSLGMAEPYIVATKEGETLLLNGAKDNEPFIGLSLYGKSHQNTVAGNQLFVAGKDKLSYSADDSVGLTTTYDPETGWFHVTGTLTGVRPTFWREENLFNMKGGVQYYFSVETVGENDYIALAESNVRNAFSKKNMSVIQLADVNANQIYSNHSYEIGTEFDLKFRIMISMGSTSLPYEPYTGGQPSPNPDYPQEIVSVGDNGEIGVNVYGGNLWDMPEESATIFGVNYSKGENGGIQISGTAESGGARMNSYFTENKILLKAGIYTLCGYCDNGAGLEFGLENLSLEVINGFVTANTPKQYTFSEDTEVIAFVQVVANGTVNQEVFVMLNAGSTALPFEPYKQPQSLIVSTPNGLPGIPVSSGGNYTDGNGQQWISDEIDFKRGKYVKKVEHYVFDGSEDEAWGIRHYYAVDIDYAYITVNRSIDAYVIELLCNMGVGRTWSAKGCCFVDDHKIFIFYHPFISNVLSQGVKAWKSWLQDNPLELYYPLETPIETDLTPEQITAYQSLHTNYPTTTVMNDEGAGMKAIYKQIENGG